MRRAVLVVAAVWVSACGQTEETVFTGRSGTKTVASRTFFLKQVGVELSIVNEEYGNYIRGSYLGKYEETTWGPSSIFTEVDGYLYNFFKTGQPNNRSHVSDTKLDVMLDAQRRYIAKSSRKKVIDDIQRHAADQVYYLYTPYPKNVASWTPWVKNYQPKNSFDRGAQLEVVWIDK